MSKTFDPQSKKRDLAFHSFTYFIGIASIIVWFFVISLILKGFCSKYRSLIHVLIASILYAFLSSGIVIDQVALLSLTEKTRVIYTEIQVMISSMIGIVITLPMLLNKNFKKTIKKLIKNKRKSTDEKQESYALKPSVYIEPKDFDFSLNVGLFSDLFDGITKITLIQILVSVTFYYLKNPSGESNKKHYSFNKADIDKLKSIIGFDFLDKINPEKISLVSFKSNIFNMIVKNHSFPNFLQSLLDQKNYEKIINLVCEEGGRSSSFVFVTSDKRFILKTIKKRERRVFIKKMLSHYTDHLFCNEESKIVRIFGTFELKKIKQNFIIMENIFYNKDRSYIFDLKGSKVDREVKGISDPKNPPCGVILKDINLLQFDYQLQLGEKANKQILRILNEDFYLLRSLGIMDYSMLLAICPAGGVKELNRYSVRSEGGMIVSVGIIDFFQEYNLGKKGEKTVKSVFNKQEGLSSANPVDYFNRIVKLVNDIFI